MICTRIDANSLAEGDYRSFEHRNGDINQPVIVTKIEDKVVAFSAVCPHASGDFREGEIYRGRAYCPVHNWKFDIVSGKCLGDESYRLKKFRTEERDGIIYIDV